MTITRKQLNEAYAAAVSLGNRRDELTLKDLDKSLRKWKKLTPRQEDFAKVLIERNSDKQLREKNKAEKSHGRKWGKDDAYQAWVLFLARFFIRSNQTAYQMHIGNRAKAAKTLLIQHQSGEVPSLSYCESMLTSKLAPRLRETFDNPPIYSAGELVQIRASEVSYYDRAKGVDKEMGFITEIEPTYVDTVAAYNKTKGGTKTYRIMFPSGEVTLRENQIKLVSRKNHNKG